MTSAVQVKTDDRTHHLLTQKFFSAPALEPSARVEDAVHRARRWGILCIALIGQVFDWLEGAKKYELTLCDVVQGSRLVL